MLYTLLLFAALSPGQPNQPAPEPALTPLEEAVVEEEKPVIETPEEEAALAPSPEQRWKLMKCLQGTWPDCLMDGCRFKCYGWTQGTYTPSTANELNTPVVWNYQANEFLLQQHWMRFEIPVVTSGTTDPSFGFRSDWLFGTDYVFTLPLGIFNDQLTANDGAPNEYGVDPICFHFQAFFPTVCHGLDVKLGRYFTPFGVESLEAINTPLVSRSYAFNWCPPFTHTGGLWTLFLNQTWTVQGGLCTGNDIFITDGAEVRFVGTCRWAPPNGRDTVTFGTSVGDPRFDDEAQFRRFNVFDLVYTHTFSPRCSYAFECIYGYQLDTPFETEEGEAFTENTNWGSIVNYLFYTFDPKCTLVSRLEFFDDFQGARTGFEGLYSAYTVGLQFRPHVPCMPANSVLILPECRWDYNGESRPFEDKHGIVTAGMELLVRW